MKNQSQQQLTNELKAAQNELDRGRLQAVDYNSIRADIVRQLKENNRKSWVGHFASTPGGMKK